MKRHLALFTGAGGPVYTGHLLGWHTVGAVEIDDYCQRVLRARQADGTFGQFEIFDDVRTFDAAAWRGRADVISAGFPCQPFSGAGRQQGANDPRNMWPETARIIDEARPEWLFLENSRNLRCKSTGFYLGQILQDLARSGYDAEWGVLSAATVGAPHARARLWIVGRLPDADREEEPGAARERRGVAVANAGEERLKAVGARPRPPEHNETSREDAPRGAGRGIWRSWPFGPGFSGVAHGVADWKHRVAALGNGWVPEQAARAWRDLSARLTKERRR